MSAIFRSETMGYYQLILPRESAWEILSELGDTSTLHYIDDNPLPLINRPFANYIKRCEELNNKCEMIRDELKKWNFEIEKPDNIDILLEKYKEQIYSRQKAGQTYLDDLEQEINEKNVWITH